MTDERNPFPYDPEAHRANLIRHVQVLSSTPDSQARWLKEHDLPAEELWLEFNDYLSGLDVAEALGAITSTERRAVEDLYAYMDSAPIDYRKGAGVLVDPEWAQVRALACAALREFS